MSKLLLYNSRQQNTPVRGGLRKKVALDSSIASPPLAAQGAETYAPCNRMTTERFHQGNSDALTLAQNTDGETATSEPNRSENTNHSSVSNQSARQTITSRRPLRSSHLSSRNNEDDDDPPRRSSASQHVPKECEASTHHKQVDGDSSHRTRREDRRDTDKEKDPDDDDIAVGPVGPTNGPTFPGIFEVRDPSAHRRLRGAQNGHI